MNPNPKLINAPKHVKHPGNDTDLRYVLVNYLWDGFNMHF